MLFRFTPIILLLIFLAGCELNSTKLEWHRENGYQWAEVSTSYFEHIGFKKLESLETNVSFKTQLTPEQINENQILLNGTGVATGDVDGDGLVDIYFAQLNGSNKLYKNTGNFKFKDITSKAGVSHEGHYSTGVLFADVDGDGDQDLLVVTVDGDNSIYINDGLGHFKLLENSGLDPGNGSTTMTMADIDSDGDLDLFVANNKKKPVYDIFEKEELDPRNLVKRPEGKQIPGKTRYEFKEPFEKYYRFIYRKNQRAMMEEIGEPNKLYLNDGTGHFKDVTDQHERFLDQNGEPAILQPEWSLTAKFQDINGDRLPDLYICNDYFTPDRIWINQGKGRFQEINDLAIRSYSYSAMGVDISDIDRDGKSDIFVTEMLSQSYERWARQQISRDMRPAMIRNSGYQPQYMRNSLYLNRGDHTFAEIVHYSGLEASEWSWATRFLDVNLDGYEDIIINTGYAYDAMDQDYGYNTERYKGAVDLETTPPLDLENKIFQNNGDLTFTEKSSEWGFRDRDVSYGLATGDFDNDGDLDLVVSRFKSTVAIYENRSTASRIAVRLKGNSPNTDAIGAEVKLEGGPVVQTKHLVSGGDYLSGSVPQIVFAAHSGKRDHTLTITWPDGKKSIIDSVVANRIYLITEPELTVKKIPAEIKSGDSSSVLFEDISGRLRHEHQDQVYDDFIRQPLLPFKLSEQGPGLSWIDYNQDGDDDLLIGGGTGGGLSIFENLGDGSFRMTDSPDREKASAADQTAIIGWNTIEGTQIIIGHSSYEVSTGSSMVSSAVRYLGDENGVVIQDSIPGISSATGPLAASDYDLDGDLDLFIGGRVIPGQYPKDATSRLFKNNDGIFEIDAENAKLFKNLGLITGAVFSDYDRDGDPDLILSSDWGSVRLFRNDGGEFKETTDSVGLNAYDGMWNGIATGDFNNDGLPDIVVTNIGENSSYQLKTAYPLKMYYSDFNMDGSIDILEASFDPLKRTFVPIRRLYDYSLFSWMIGGRIQSYRQYAQASLVNLLGFPLEELPQKQVNTLQHMLFLNTGNGFKARPLPKEAQFTAAFAASVADYDNDGHEDLFLSQNFFGVRTEMPRLDAGRGLWLRGNGEGHFNPVLGSISGIKIYGQQRGAALSDFNRDGKVDLAVGQNDTTTKLFLNQTSRKGIRIRLEGPKENKQGIGSSIRLVYEDGSKGPLREVQAGSGHYSMNSTIQVLGVSEKNKPVQIQVCWFDGSLEFVDIRQNIWEYIISWSNSI